MPPPERGRVRFAFDRLGNIRTVILIKKASLLVQTMKYFSFDQVLYLVYRRLFGNLQWLTGHKFKRVGQGESVSLRGGFQLDSSLANKKSKCIDQQLVFLNQAPETLLGSEFSWSAEARDKLWRYNLHYFDWLKDEQIDSSFQYRVIQHWIDHNPRGQGDGWEPYPISLRIVNWVKFFKKLTARGSLVEKRWVHSLYEHILFLDDCIEFHIRANHLLKNLVALIYGCFYFDTPKTQRILSKTLTLFHQEILEQFNEDGGHYERSPMYHGICLEDLLDVYHLIVANPAVDVNETLVTTLQQKILNGLMYYRQVHLTPKRLALMSDSAEGIAPEMEAVFAYANRLGIKDAGSQHSSALAGDLISSESAYLPDTGYLNLTSRSLKCLMSLGSPAPNYQPGHTHCDLLSFELAYQGNPFIVDTGVFEYQEGNRRYYSRSTEAHNTVQLNNIEQHQIWGAFRIAQRAQSQVLSVDTHEQGGSVIAQHNGFAREERDLNHKRFLSVNGDQLVIQDELIVVESDSRNTDKGADSSRRAQMVSRLHLHPEVELGSIDQAAGVVVLMKEDSPVAYLRLAEKDCEDIQINIKPCDYYPEFGKQETGTCIELMRIGVFPLSISLSIDFE